MKWITCTPEVFSNEDWNQDHYRYKFSNCKLDTDLFEVRDGALMKIGGSGRLEFSAIEYLDESADPPTTENICKNCGRFFAYCNCVGNNTYPPSTQIFYNCALQFFYHVHNNPGVNNIPEVLEQWLPKFIEGKNNFDYKNISQQGEQC